MAPPDKEQHNRDIPPDQLRGNIQQHILYQTHCDFRTTICTNNDLDFPVEMQQAAYDLCESIYFNALNGGKIDFKTQNNPLLPLIPNKVRKDIGKQAPAVHGAYRTALRNPPIAPMFYAVLRTASQWFLLSLAYKNTAADPEEKSRHHIHSPLAGFNELDWIIVLNIIATGIHFANTRTNGALAWDHPIIEETTEPLHLFYYKAITTGKPPTENRIKITATPSLPEMAASIQKKFKKAKRSATKFTDFCLDEAMRVGALLVIAHNADTAKQQHACPETGPTAKTWRNSHNLNPWQTSH